MVLKEKTIEKFYREIYKPAFSMEEFIDRMEGCFRGIAEELSLAKMECVLNAEKTMLRNPVVNGVKVFYDSYKPLGESFSMHYVNGDGSRLDILFYAEKGHVFTEEEKSCIPLISNPLYTILSYITIRNLLERAVNMDLAVGVSNLTAFDKHVDSLIQEKRIENYHAAYLNIHNFKYVNRVLTYHGGNEVLRIFAEEIQKSLRSDEMIARLGGDNFVVLVRNENVDDFCNLVRNIHIDYEQNEKRYQFELTVTMGVSHMQTVSDMGDIMLRVSVAYQKAREKKSGGFAFYTDEILQSVMKEKEIIACFERALAAKEFVVYYQPKIKTVGSIINGAEALVRWNKDGKVVSPGEFIPVLEKDGSVCKLDFYVLETVCQFLKELQDEGSPLIKISVNFSKCHMENESLAQDISDVINRYGIPHQYIEIELTESEDFDDYAVIARVVNSLRAEGIYTSIDDFGTGFSSLNLLRLIQVDLLKIDRAFIPMDEEFERRFRDLVMFKNIVRMAKELGIQIVAEGVETKEQYDYISTTGCDMIQGYYFDKPLPKDEFLKKLKIGKY